MRRALIFSMMATIPFATSACGQPLSGPVKPTAETPQAKGWTMTTLIEGLEHPWAVAFLPGAAGDMLITERPGRLRIVRGGKLDPVPVHGVPNVLAQRQGGLLDVALHPDFENNKLVYLSFSHGKPDANHTRIVRGTFDGESLRDVQVIFDATPEKGGGFHFGCRMLFLPDGSLLLSVGDGFNRRNDAQSVGSHLGKLLRIKDDGATATGNPFHARGDALPEVWSIGHRNIQGLAMDRASGRIWATEHGPKGGDELNLVEPGKNYGWPEATYGREYHGPRVSEHTRLDGMEDPQVVWTPCIAPSGLVFYTGELFPQWKGDLFAGGLILEQVRRIDLDDQGKVIGQETLSIGHRVRDVRQGPDGALYLVTDEEKGRLIKIEPKGG